MSAVKSNFNTLLQKNAVQLDIMLYVYDQKEKSKSSSLCNGLCYLQIHAEGEAEHAAIGHDAVLGFVPAEHESTLRRAMRDHDRDFSVFYNRLADMLQ